jgi:hypothetical protein
MGENFSNEVDQVLNLYGDHMRIFTLVPGSAPQRRPAPAPVFMTGLAATLSEKSRACLWLPPSSGCDCGDLPGRYASRR